MESCPNLLVNMPLRESTVHVLYAGAKIDSATTITEMMEIGFAMFADPEMAFDYCKKVSVSLLLRQHEKSIRS